MKKFILILIFILFSRIAYGASLSDCSYYIGRGDSNYKNWQKYKRDNYLDLALNSYYKAYLNDNSNVNALIGLSKVYLAKKEYKKAKDAFQLAKNLAFESPKVNFQIAEYNFATQEYVEALDYYLYAVDYGYKNDFQTNLQIAITLEKLGDIENAKKFYQYAHSLNPKSDIPTKRLEDIDKIPKNPVKESLILEGVEVD